VKIQFVQGGGEIMRQGKKEEKGLVGGNTKNVKWVGSLRKTKVLANRCPRFVVQE
jgi:hypothetical protein